MKIPILTYHSLGESHSVLSTPAKIFLRQMEDLVAWGYHTIHLRDFESYAKLPADNQPRAVITFDDAYTSIKQAVPILKKLKFSATIFVPTGFCGKNGGWKGAAGQVMTWEELKELAQIGFELGSHSVDHLDLTRVDDRQLHLQLGQSKVEIEQRTSCPVTAMAYPYGRLNRAVRACAGKYYGVAVSTRLAWADAAQDLLCLPRVDLFYFQNPRVWRHFNDYWGAGYLRLRWFGRLLRSGRKA